jgi:4-amino-4-deoxy-L-arabinose transferase-like glycosyltransferase
MLKFHRLSHYTPPIIRNLGRPPYPEIILVLFAALTRCWQLTYHSIWFDEAVTLQWATSQVSWTWRKTFPLLEDKHPPVYYISLHGWIKLLALFGLNHNDAALRLFGSLLGVLTVWGIMRLASQLSGRVTGLLAGWLTALSPVLVWYSQELRMFQPATTGLVWASYCLLRAWQGERWVSRLGWWLGFVFTLEAALYSYLFSAFLLPAAGLTLLLLLIHSRPHIDKHSPFTIRIFFEGILALALTTILFLPLAYNAWVVNHDEGTPGSAFAHFVSNLWRLLRVFTLWRADWHAMELTASLAFLALLWLTGLLLPQPATRLRRPDQLWLALWIGIPLLIGNVLLSRSASVFAEDRYFLFLAPFVLWAIARGIVGLGERWPVLGLVGGGATSLLLLLALPQVWTPEHYRENWRAAAAYIAAYQQKSPGLAGVGVAHVDYTRRPLQWYLRQQLNSAQLPLFYPFGGQLEPDEVEQKVAPPLQGIVDQGAATLWLTQSHLDGVDDQRLVEGWLNQHFPLVTELYPTGIKLSGYALQSRFVKLPTLAATATYPAAEILPGLQLAACEILTPQLSAQDTQMHPPSGWVHVRLWWQALAPLHDNYVATAQMVGPEGVWGDRLYRDNETLRRWPTSTWQVGDIYRDEVDINLNPLTPSRPFPIVIGVLDGAGQPMGAKVECGRVTVQ